MKKSQNTRFAAVIDFINILRQLKYGVGGRKSLSEPAVHMASKEQRLRVSVVIRKYTSLGNGFATFLHKAYLLRNLAQSADNLLVSIVEREYGIRNTSVTAKLENELLRTTEIVAGDTRVEMMDSLELQASVEKVEPCWAVDVHGGAEHLLRERFADSEVSG